MNEATIDSMLLASIGQFENQATNRLLIAELEECEDSGTTQNATLSKYWRPLTNLAYKFRACHLCIFNVAAIFFGVIPTYGIE